MVLDAEFLSRIQFAFTVGFHILFPTLNLGLALFLAIMEGVWLKTRNPKYLELCKFWTKIFALTFGMGVVSGIVMSYELGTNFGRFTEAVGGVLGSLFAYEVLSAFFLEAGFLGVMLFGWNRVSPKLHYAATFLVMIGTAISAFWIMSANSWMQTPAGYELKNGIFIVKSWWDVIFNPSVHVRFFHMMLASYITTAFVIAAVSAYYLLRKRHVSVAKTCMSFAMWAALIVVPAQILMGDAVGLEVHKYQPLKTAAIEGVWETGGSKPLLLFAVPDQEKQKNFFEIKIPYGASLINTHSLDGELLGLKSVPPKEQPYVPLVFYSFRIMVGIGMLFLLIALTGLYLRIRKRLYESKTFLRICMLVAPLGFLATISGWVTAETGRQPWVVYGLLTTADGASIIPTVHVATSLTLFITVYVIIFGFYLYYLFKTIRK
ncbi:MAG: cytochrome ubiquinol oxidase subunit I [Pseudomonadota bacterium]